MRIIIDTIPAKAQPPHAPAGNWQVYEERGQPALYIQVSEMGNDVYEFLVAIHETVESFLCFKRGISTEDVDAFDKEFEKSRTFQSPELNVFTFRDRTVREDAEPGEQSDAPYAKEHEFASMIERQIAYELGVDWSAYDKTISEL